MSARFTCPNCGKSGSVKKEIPVGAKIRCPRCQTSFAPAIDEDQVQAFLRTPPQVRAEDEPVVAHTAQPKAWKDPPILDIDGEPPPIPRSSTTTAQYEPMVTRTPSQPSSAGETTIKPPPFTAMQKPHRSLVLVSAGALICVLILLIGGSLSPKIRPGLFGPVPKIRPGLFDPVTRSAKAIEGSARVGLDLDRFRGLLQEFSTELEVVEEKLRTDEERSVFNEYLSALNIYRDSLPIWEMDKRRPEFANLIQQAMDKKDEEFRSYQEANKPTTLDRRALEEALRSIVEFGRAVGAEQGALISWRNALNRGSIPAYQVGIANPKGGKSFLGMPDEIKIQNFSEVCDRYNLRIDTISGYAFMPPETIHTIWELAKKKALEARKHANSEG